MAQVLFNTTKRIIKGSLQGYLLYLAVLMESMLGRGLRSLRYDATSRQGGSRRFLPP